MTSIANTIFTVEEEGFCLHLIEAIEKQKVKNQLSTILESLSENTSDIKSVLFRLKKYSKTIKGEGFTFNQISNSIQKNKETFVLIIFQVYDIALKLRLEDSFLSIIYHYLHNRNLSASITLLTEYNRKVNLN
jgi:hypothetical protein